MSRHSNVAPGPYTFRCSEGDLPVHILGSGAIAGDDATFTNDRLVDWLVYSGGMLGHEDPAFWFGRRESVGRLLHDPLQEMIGQDPPRITGQCVVKMVHITGPSVRLDHRGSGFFRAVELEPNSYQLTPYLLD